MESFFFCALDDHMRMLSVGPGLVPSMAASAIKKPYGYVYRSLVGRIDGRSVVRWEREKGRSIKASVVVQRYLSQEKKNV